MLFAIPQLALFMYGGALFLPHRLAHELCPFVLGVAVIVLAETREKKLCIQVLWCISQSMLFKESSFIKHWAPLHFYFCLFVFLGNLLSLTECKELSIWSQVYSRPFYLFLVASNLFTALVANCKCLKIYYHASKQITNRWTYFQNKSLQIMYLDGTKS